MRFGDALMNLQTGKTESSRGFFERFLHSEVSGSIILLACTGIALAWANSPWSESYWHILHTKIGISWGDTTYALSVHHWINDGLMVIFFFAVGLEIKRELLVGHLSSVKKALLPVAAAFGGMVVPACVYAILNAGGEGSRGWGVPMATDIAFSLGMLAVLGKRVPISLKVFLTAAAIADDLGAVVVLALFYTETIRLIGLVFALVLLGLLYYVVRVLRIRRLGVVFGLIIVVWIGVFVSGIHATVAGVLVALLVPVKPVAEPRRLLARAEERVQCLKTANAVPESLLFDQPSLEAAMELEETARRMQPVGLRLEQYWHPVQAFMILPLFALANAGIPLHSGVVQAAASPVGLGVILGLFLGKQGGFMLFTWLAVRSGKAELPEDIHWKQFWGMSCLAGIGFTMSLFVSELAFEDAALLANAKVGILAGSLASAVFGYFVLNTVLPKETHPCPSTR